VVKFLWVLSKDTYNGRAIVQLSMYDGS